MATVGGKQGASRTREQTGRVEKCFLGTLSEQSSVALVSSYQ